MLKNKLQKGGFTLVEMLITVLVTGILLGASAPLITNFSMLRTGIDKNVVACIQANNSSAWYNTTTGAASVPDSASDPKCYWAVDNTRTEKGNTYNTVAYYAETGTTAEKKLAKQILRVSCDLGGTRACDYFINSCLKNGGTYCNDTEHVDLRYYLVQDVLSSNLGAIAITEKLENSIVSMPSNIITEVNAACANPENSITDNIACYLIKPDKYIKACNLGNTAACQYAFTNEYNRSCTEILTNYPEAQTGTYKIPYNSNGDTISVSCNMGSQAKAAISGCNAALSNADLLLNTETSDCLVGFNNDYNKHCQQIADNWPSLPDGVYAVTWKAWNNLRTETCQASTPDPDDTAKNAPLGAPVVATDGSLYAGIYYTGANFYDYYITRYEQGPLSPGDGVTAGNVDITGATSLVDGAANTAALRSWSEYYTSTPVSGIINRFEAVEACSAMIHGKSDWFVPSQLEGYYLFCNGERVTSLWPSCVNETVSSTSEGSNFWSQRRLSNNTYRYSTASTLNYVTCMRKIPIADPICNGTEKHMQLCKIDGQVVRRIIYPIFGANKVYMTVKPATSKNYQAAYGVTGATSTTDGMSNTDILTNPANTYTATAAQYCRSLGANWYLPAQNELSPIISDNDAKHEVTARGKYDLWTSTEPPDIDGSGSTADGYNYAVIYDNSNNMQWVIKTNTYMNGVACYRRL